MIRVSRLGQMALALLVIITGSATLPASDLIFDNRTATIFNVFCPDITGSTTLGIALSVGATGYTLDSFDWVPVGNPAGTETATLGLYALDSNNKPTGSAIVSESRSIQFKALASATTADQISLTPTNSSAWRLEANNKYALLFSITGTGKGIALANPFSSSPNMSGGGMTYLGIASSSNSGATWTLTSVANPWAAIRGTAIPVPEPSTYALGAIATGVMAAVARRRKARKG